MKDIKIEALKLRRQGLSYNEINAELGVPKSTLSGWCKDIVLSDQARSRLSSRVKQGTRNGLIERNILQTHIAKQRETETKQEAKNQFPELSKRDLLIIGTSLYWAEGYKRPIVRDGKERTSHAISFVNADPAMIHIFIRFLVEILEVPREEIRATMRLYGHINEREARAYWLHQSGLPESSFRNSTFLVSGASKGRRPYNRLPYGTLQIGVYKTKEFQRIMGFIEGMKMQA